MCKIYFIFIIVTGLGPESEPEWKINNLTRLIAELFRDTGTGTTHIVSRVEYRFRYVDYDFDCFFSSPQLPFT